MDWYHNIRVYHQVSIPLRNLMLICFYQSTVMLAVDVSFLAVPNVNIGSSQSVGIIATYLSIILLTGSLIVSLLLARQNQKYGAESADRAVSFQLSVHLCHAN
jgi:Flp pilus assembly protein protease CpaA